MKIAERKATLIQQINNIQDPQTLEMLEISLKYFTDSTADITDGLTEHELTELRASMAEPADKNSILEDEFKTVFKKWSTK